MKKFLFSSCFLIVIFLFVANLNKAYANVAPNTPVLVEPLSGSGQATG